MATNNQPGPVSAGWRILWDTQRVLWGVYAVNLALGLFAAVGMMIRVGGVLDHSLTASKLYHGFDLAYFIELAAHPDVQMGTRVTSAFSFSAIFFIFMLFATGGILQTYLRNRHLVPGEFFQGCGAFFWRFVRLLLWLAVALLPLIVLALLVSSVSSRLSSDSPYEKLGFWVDVIGLGIIGLALMAVRLWFDMAQVQTVAEDEHHMTRTVGRAFRLTFSNFFPLFWIYLRLSLLAWAGTALAMYLWVKFVPAEQIGLAFLLGQFIAWLWLATRLWQRASEAAWYLRQRPQPEPAVIQTSEPASPEIIPEFTPPQAPEA